MNICHGQERRQGGKKSIKFTAVTFDAAYPTTTEALVTIIATKNSASRVAFEERLVQTPAA